MPDREETKGILYRLDSFTPKAFVSHAANVSAKDLDRIDLLPKLRGKVLLTKELAPLFRGKTEDLRANFATLTAVLDGKGHVSATGAQGTRGYSEVCVFNWLGGTTPIPAGTDAIMAQLGNRLLRYEIVGQEQSEEDLIAFVENYAATTIEEECRSRTNLCIVAHFNAHPLNSVDPESVSIPRKSALQIARLAKLIASGRVEVHGVDGGDACFVAGEPEGPHRVILLLRTFAQGLALICGGGCVGEDEIAMLRHVAFSSIPRHRRTILRAVLTSGGDISSTRAEKQLGISRPSVRGWMRELAATGIVEFEEGCGNGADRVILNPKWRWLLEGEPVAESEKGVCEEGIAATQQ
ncbi:MAG: hypothetical protein HYX72_00435 [Acidobacteria bacterium]|nr:hypothetical protein [Acidobacteriota bacterium]